jgi:hypothetical protein
VDFDFEGGRVGCEEFPVIREARELIGLDVLEGVTEGHFAMAMMMPVGFAISGDVDELIFSPVFDEGVSQAMGETFAFGEEPFEGDGLRHGGIIEKDYDLPIFGQAHEVRHLGINPSTIDILPVAAGDWPDPFGLEGGEDGKGDAELGEDIEGGNIGGGFGQPHAFGVAAEARLEIANSPEDLGSPIPFVGEREDHMIVSLGQGRPMSGEAGDALGIGIENGLIDIRGAVLQPGKEGRAEVEADARIVIQDFGDATIAIQHAGEGIGRVALCGDTFVPIMVRVGGILEFDRLEPGIFARWLVKVAVDADVSTHERWIR